MFFINFPTDLGNIPSRSAASRFLHDRHRIHHGFIDEVSNVVSGIYLRGTLQVQIWDTGDKTKIEQGANKGSGGLYNNKKHARIPLVKADNPVGEWNTFRIRMIGERVSIWLNDKLVVDNVVMENHWQPEKPISSTGQIELQAYGNKTFFPNVTCSSRNSMPHKTDRIETAMVTRLQPGKRWRARSRKTVN